MTQLSQKSVVRRDTCRLCGSKNLKLALRLAPTPSGDAYVVEKDLEQSEEFFALDIVLCLDCGHAQLWEVVNPDLLYSGYTYTSSVSSGLAAHFKDYADSVLDGFKFPEKSLVLDIGSNDGTLLSFFQKRGMQVLGIDPAAHIAKQATQKGIQTLAGFFTQDFARKIKQERGPVAIITANNVFANIDNLDDIIAGVKILLAQDGVFVMETSYLMDVLEKMLIETVFHEHLSYFSLRPLQSFFKRHGMQVVDVKRVATKGGSLRV
ncbi:MAG: methyltransferase domain-containing protein, partial [Candidatus Omnitrophica bacterium]|nr:methyltransferase domain-containing protein [Candidatus Omnitrophota bacterium]